mmetsp:Transcript_6107/g.14101  ORF Transcript_6107/g.14101 Transcript_6107/m.14101 type:complete len:423 (-) Transcript_6107:126-1394(-)
MVDAEAVLAAELQESRRRAEELSALLEAERRRAQEAERKLYEKERLLRESEKSPLDERVVQGVRKRFEEDEIALKQHAQRFSNAAAAIDVVIPGLKANAKAVQDQIATHFTFLRKQLKDREEKLLAVVEGLASEKLRALENQKSRMQTIVSACEKAINSTDELLQGDDWSLLTKKDSVAEQVATAIAGTCKLDAEWSEKIQANLPGTLEEIIESHGVVSLASIEMPETEWHKDLAVVSRIAEPPRHLKSSRASQGNSDFGFMFDIQAKKNSICVRALYLASGTGGGPWPYTVYTVAGSWKAMASKKKKWTMVSKENVVLPAVSSREHAALKLLEDGVHVAAGARQAFYVHSSAHMTAVAFTVKPMDPETSTTLKDGAIVDEDDHLSVHTGAKTCSEVAFESVTTDAVRSFYGSVEYVLWCES